MSGLIVGMIAETFIHPGAGQSAGAIDLPVSREQVTQYPFIPGSGVKGALRVWSKERANLDDAEIKKLFGLSDNAGELLVSDARLLLLPVRSLSCAYIWLTCPLILERLARDADRMGNAVAAVAPKCDAEKYLGMKRDKLSLEEREFDYSGDLPNPVIDLLRKFIPVEFHSRLGEQLAIVSNDEFAWFAAYGLPVAARNQLDGNKISKNLWYEETLPPDTLMYILLAPRSGNKTGAAELAALSDSLRKSPYSQFGGNETVGQGWFKLLIVKW